MKTKNYLIFSSFVTIIVTTALVSGIMQKPVAAVLLLMLCFSLEAIVVMIIVAVLGSIIPFKKILKVGEV